MKMLRNLLEKLNRVWYEKSRVAPVITLRKGTGTHRMVTLESGTLYFHSLPYTENMAQSQEVVLDELTISELTTTIQGMGYQVTTESTAYLNDSALNLLEVMDRSLVSGETLYGFTSNLWRVLYPFHRQLSEANRDIDLAVEQILLPSARGEWLDYWVGFFKMKRLVDEKDETLLRRAMLTITSVKSNDVAIEELISFHIDASVRVLDYVPGKFEVRVSPEFTTSAQKVHDILGTLKGAGIDYILNYAVEFTESYPVSFRSFKGKTFKEVNESYHSGTIDFGRYEDDWSKIPAERALSGFVLNSSRLNGKQKLSVSDMRITETVRMVMTRLSDGAIIQQM